VCWVGLCCVLLTSSRQSSIRSLDAIFVCWLILNVVFQIRSSWMKPAKIVVNKIVIVSGNGCDNVTKANWYSSAHKKLAAALPSISVLLPQMPGWFDLTRRMVECESDFFVCRC
jgi:ABC-type dipeptide/oligopeptide/nickel transport system permease component